MSAQPSEASVPDTSPESQPTKYLYIGTNLKLHQTPEESAAYLAGLGAATGHLAGRPDLRRFVIPPFTSLPTAVEVAQGTGIWIGAQNVHWAPDGAFTGEISTRMLQAVGVDFVLIGHAERRNVFRETDEEINKKVLAATDAGFSVLFCIGETAAEKEWGVGPESVVRQLKIGLHALPPEQSDRILIGYEPVWSIGASGTPARPEDVAEITTHIRQALTERFGEAGREVPILYGGSVDPSNCRSFIDVPEISGLFVGRAGWTVEGYARLLEAALDTGSS